MPRWIQLGLILGLLTSCEPTVEPGSLEPDSSSQAAPSAPSLAQKESTPQPVAQPMAPELKEEPIEDTPAVPAPLVSSSAVSEAPQAPNPPPTEPRPKLKPLHWSAKGYAKAPWSIPKGQELDLFTQTPLAKLQEVLTQRYPLSSQLDEAFAWLKTQPQVAKVTWIRDQDTLQIQIKKGAFGFYRPSDARPRHHHP